MAVCAYCGPGTNKPSNGRRPNRDATFLTGKIVLPVLRLIVLLLALAPVVYYLLSLYCIIGYFRALRKLPPRSGEYTPPASILKPARGVAGCGAEAAGVAGVSGALVTFEAGTVVIGSVMQVLS